MLWVFILFTVKEKHNMPIKLNLQIRTVSLVLTVFFGLSICAQEATSFLKDYYLIGIQGNYLRFKEGQTKSVEDPIIAYNIDEVNGALYGVIVNVWNKNHWNFKTGLLLKYSEIAESYFFPKEQTGLTYDFALRTRFGTESHIKSIPLYAEYIVSVSKTIKPYLVAGPTFGYLKEYGGGGYHKHGTSELEIVFDDNLDNPFYMNFEVGAGIYFLLKHHMMQLQFTYSKSLTNILEGNYTVSNIIGQDYTSTTGTLSQSGDYWAVGLSFYIKKRGKNKKR